MFKKILIANRGEIACRVARTARALGIGTVAVYSDADRDALHVEACDEAVHIGPAPASQSYLVIDRIVDACRRTGADAVHPGYGFLSEREAFPRALAEAGIAWIGPHPGAIAAMGDKIESKKAAAAAGVSTVPGFLGTITDAEHALRIAGEIGYPVMLKASAGGGGKGMRVAWSADEVREGFERSRSEAQSSFGDDRMFVEKFIVDPRHVEIQVIGDKHGNVIHLGERECSIQRRNQKVLEEAPSPLLDEATRAAMGAQAVALAKAVGYDSAGTVEFVAGQDRSFFFLEMNTRLQVEHPVTEMVTGLDLVELMIRVAAGERLPLAQDEVRLYGWAVESRVYAEDPTRGFLPSTGRLTAYRPPPEGRDAADVEATIRNDTGVGEGGEISIHYDPMVAKLVTHAPTRERAIEAQGRALDAFAVEGIRHNIPFLSALMAHPRWREGRLSTGFIAEEFPDGFAPALPEGEELRRIAAVAFAIDAKLFARARAGHALGGAGPGGAERRRVALVGEGPAGAARVEARVRLDGGTVLVSPADEGGPLDVASAWRPGEPVWRGTVGGTPLAVRLRRVTGGFLMAHGGAEARVRVVSPRAAELSALMPEKTSAGGGKQVLCPMPGVVRSIAVSPGTSVKAGEPLAVVEAMKMENVLRAERDGTIATVHAKAGDSLAVDAVILEFA